MAGEPGGAAHRVADPVTSRIPLDLRMGMAPAGIVGPYGDNYLCRCGAPEAIDEPFEERNEILAVVWRQKAAHNLDLRSGHHAQAIAALRLSSGAFN